MEKQEWLQKLVDTLNEGVNEGIIDKLTISSMGQYRCTNCINCTEHDVVIYYSFPKVENNVIQPNET